MGEHNKRSPWRCITFTSTSELCTSQPHMPPRFGLLTNRLPLPPPCWLVTSQPPVKAAAGHSKSHLSATSSASSSQPVTHVRSLSPPPHLHRFSSPPRLHFSLCPPFTCLRFDLSTCGPPFTSHSSPIPPPLHSLILEPLCPGHYSAIISLIRCWLDLFLITT